MEVAVSRTGEWRYEHERVALQIWSQPLSVRPLDGPGGWRELAPGARVWLPGERQHFEWREASRTQVIVLTPGRIEHVLQRPCSQTNWEHWRGMDFCSPLMNRVVDAIFQDLAEGSPAGPLALDSLAASLIAYLDAGPERVVPSDRVCRICSKGFARVLQYIETHLDQPLRAARLAQEAGCSPRQLSQAFRARQGMLPHEYVVHRRVKRAEALLETDHFSLAQIAVDVGFADQSQMTKAFRKVLGITPGRCRGRRRCYARSG